MYSTMWQPSFRARTESGIFRAVLKADPIFDEQPWPELSSEAKDFVKQILNKDPRKWMTAAQALSESLILPFVYQFYIYGPSETLTVDELFYLKEKFILLEPSKNNTISVENIKTALMKYATDAMKESRIYDLLASFNALQYRRMDFEEFSAAVLSVHQLEALERWEQHTHCVYEIFEKEGNITIMNEESASVRIL